MLQGLQVLQGRYQLQQQLGRNAGRQTWLAADIKTSPAETVIVKFLAFSPQMQWEDFKLFEREAQVLKNLNHARIPRYRDYFSLDKHTGSGLCWFALVQDYIPGSSLQQLIDEGERFSETQVQQIATDLLNILIYLHDLSPPVLHRDIKPSNLILAENGQVQERAKAEGVTFTVVGTSGYAPPEQLWGKAVPVSDLYALGATLIHLLTGTAPADLPQHQMRLEFRDKVNINTALATWIEQLTEPAPEKRFVSAKEALEELQVPRHSSGKIYQPAGETVNYGRLILLSLCATVLSGCVVFLPMLIFLPALLSGNSTKTKQTEAKHYVSAMNKSQQAYHLEYGKFVTHDNKKGWDKLGLGIKTETNKYIYSFHGREKAVFNYAISKDDNLKSYVGGVFVVSDIKGEVNTHAIVCESNSPLTIHPNDPTYQNGVVTCGFGTRNISKY
ncbi:MAG TPA: hypothetical protein DDW51_29280 [Cyanobacteria bacterium UBA11367]|nr:hypothetical protein [Cyanobacteria bacterium UBA11367]